jgi:hypothetical protein
MSLLAEIVKILTLISTFLTYKRLDAYFPGGLFNPDFCHTHTGEGSGGIYPDTSQSFRFLSHERATM